MAPSRRSDSSKIQRPQEQPADHVEHSCSMMGSRTVTSDTYGSAACRTMPRNPAVKVRSKDLEATHRTSDVASDLLFLSGRRDLNPRPLDPSHEQGVWDGLRESDGELLTCTNAPGKSG